MKKISTNKILTILGVIYIVIGLLLAYGLLATLAFGINESVCKMVSVSIPISIIFCSCSFLIIGLKYLDSISYKEKISRNAE